MTFKPHFHTVRRRQAPDGAARKTHKSNTLISIIAFSLRTAPCVKTQKSSTVRFLRFLLRHLPSKTQHDARSENAMTEINAFDLCVFTCGLPQTDEDSENANYKYHVFDFCVVVRCRQVPDGTVRQRT
jgi:hypothetical protein